VVAVSRLSNPAPPTRFGDSCNLPTMECPAGNGIRAEVRLDSSDRARVFLAG